MIITKDFLKKIQPTSNEPKFSLPNIDNIEICGFNVFIPFQKNLIFLSICR